jgi:hypothetical protein
MAHKPMSEEEISRSKWMGIPQRQLEEVESRQRQRITALEEMLSRERQELAAIVAAKSSNASKYQTKYGLDKAPDRYSHDLSWKDKILYVINQEGHPMLGKEIGPRLRQLQPYGLVFSNLDNTVSVHLSKLVKEGQVIRVSRRGKAGSRYAIPE